MDKDVKDLIENFKRISKKGLIKGISNSFGSIGLTFEKELEKDADAMYFPDYNGIELKCTSKFSKYPLYLFTVAFDGPTFPEINRIIEKYGWPDKDYPDKKVFFANLHNNKKTFINKHYFRLQFNDAKEKLFLCVYNKNNELIEKKSFVYTDTICNHLCLKLNKLAIIHASIIKKNNEKYYKYYDINIYNLIGFDKFLYLFEHDYITVSLIARMNKSGVDTGRYRNKNLVFSIKKEKIELLFNKIYSYNIYK